MEQPDSAPTISSRLGNITALDRQRLGGCRFSFLKTVAFRTIRAMMSTARAPLTDQDAALRCAYEELI